MRIFRPDKPEGCAEYELKKKVTRQDLEASAKLRIAAIEERINDEVSNNFTNAGVLKGQIEGICKGVRCQMMGLCSAQIQQELKPVKKELDEQIAQARAPYSDDFMQAIGAILLEQSEAKKENGDIKKETPTSSSDVHSEPWYERVRRKIGVKMASIGL